MPSLAQSLAGGTTDPQTAVNTAAIAGKADVEQAIVTVSGTTYTLRSDDIGKLLRLTNAAAIALTVPDSFGPAVGRRSVVNVEQVGAGIVTVVGSGTRVVTPTAGFQASSRGQGSELRLSLIGTSACGVRGDLAPA